MYWESFKAESAMFADKLNDIIRQGNVRRVVVEHQGKTVAEFPLTAGVVGLVRRRSPRPSGPLWRC